MHTKNDEKKKNVECGREAGYVLSVLYTHRTHRILFEMAEPLLTHGCPPVFVHYFYGYLSYIAFFDVAFLCHIRSAGCLAGWRYLNHFCQQMCDWIIKKEQQWSLIVRSMRLITAVYVWAANEHFLFLWWIAHSSRHVCWLKTSVTASLLSSCVGTPHFIRYQSTLSIQARLRN